MTPRQLRRSTRLALLLAALTLPACKGMLYETTGDMMSSYSVEHVMPFVMAQGDVGMACETGVSMGYFLISFGRVTAEPDRAAIVTLLPAGMCAEGQAWEEDLRQLRSLHEQRSPEAQDARFAEKRAHQTAARRFYGAYKRLEAAFGPPGEGCPELEPGDDALYLMGLEAGLLAVVHDRASGGEAGVPMSIPPAVSRATKCLDNERFWGAPAALEATLQSTIPGLLPEGVDAWKNLEDAAALGREKGVRLADAMWVLGAAAAGREDDLKRAIVAHAASMTEKPPSGDFKLLDVYAHLIILHESDRLWTQATGHRTPPGALGTFYEPPTEEPADDSLFEGLDDLEVPE